MLWSIYPCLIDNTVLISDLASVKYSVMASVPSNKTLHICHSFTEL